MLIFVILACVLHLPGLLGNDCNVTPVCKDETTPQGYRDQTYRHWPCNCHKGYSCINQDLIVEDCGEDVITFRGECFWVNSGPPEFCQDVDPNCQEPTDMDCVQYVNGRSDDFRNPCNCTGHYYCENQKIVLRDCSRFGSGYYYFMGLSKSCVPYESVDSFWCENATISTTTVETTEYTTIDTTVDTTYETTEYTTIDTTVIDTDCIPPTDKTCEEFVDPYEGYNITLYHHWPCNCHKGYYCENKKLQTIDCEKKVLQMGTNCVDASLFPADFCLSTICKPHEMKDCSIYDDGSSDYFPFGGGCGDSLFSCHGFYYCYEKRMWDNKCFDIGDLFGFFLPSTSYTCSDRMASINCQSTTLSTIPSQTDTTYETEETTYQTTDYTTHETTVVTTTEATSETTLPITTSTIDSTKTTTKLSSTTVKSECIKEDSRGVIWQASFGELAERNCSETVNTTVGISFWYCDGFLGTFRTPEPDRSECIDSWINDIQDMIDNGEATDIEIMDYINENVEQAKKNSSGGSIINISLVLESLVSGDNQASTDSQEFANLYVKTSNEIFSSYLGWMEITDENLKLNTLTKNLETLDQVGYHLGRSSVRNQQCGKTTRIEYQIVELKTHSLEEGPDTNEKCFEFNDKGTICISSGTNVQKSKECNIYVQTSIQTKSHPFDKISPIFPDKPFETLNNGGMLGDRLIGLTVNNGTKMDKDFLSTIIFNMGEVYENIPGCQFIPGYPECIYYDTDSNEWSTNGCKRLSVKGKEVTCQCNHLTNFGIMLDWTNQVKADDPELDILTLILLTCSVGAIIITELLHQFSRKEESNTIRPVERNRNVCLAIAQLSFVIFVGRNDILPCVVCEVMGAFTHFAWLATFAWIVIEANTIFHTLAEGHAQVNLKFNVVAAYGLPFALAAGMLASSIVSDMYLYLRRTEDQHVNSCWLNGYATMGLIIPIGIALVFNTARIVVTFRYANIEKIQRTKSIWKKFLIIMSAYANTLVLSAILCTNFVFAWFGGSRIIGYMTVFLNVIPGFYILLSSIIYDNEVLHGIQTAFSSKFGKKHKI